MRKPDPTNAMTGNKDLVTAYITANILRPLLLAHP